MFLRRIVAFFWPGGIILGAALIVLATGMLGFRFLLLGRILPPAVLCTALFIGVRFQRGRLVYAILALTAADRILVHCAGYPAWTTDAARMVALLLPLNLVLAALLRERGVFSLSALLRISLLVLQAGLAVLLLVFQRTQVSHWLTFSPFWHDLGKQVLTQPILMVWIASFLILAFIFWSKQQALDHGLFWSAAAALVPFAVNDAWGIQATLYITTAGVILVVAALEAAYSMAFRDELTGLPARRALNEAMQRLSSRYAVAMLDIDFFKKFNDRYGHDVGDQVLRMVAARMATVAGGGRPYRYGGEEFTILFPGKTVAEVLPHLESVRRNIGGAGFCVRSKGRPRKKPKKKRGSRSEDRSVTITVSIGVADAGHGGPQKTLKAADKALYRAKKRGRNQVAQ
jgi:diguanylate cyclase (GGDEF)-like protein